MDSQQEKEKWPYEVFGGLYRDQGMKKWHGFYLADFTEAWDENKENSTAINKKEK